MPLSTSQTSRGRRVWAFLGIMIVVKCVLATARRLIFPFAVFVAAALDTSLWLLSVSLALMRVSTLAGLALAPHLWKQKQKPKHKIN
jgi:disulfide bond formation protein DsbB